MDPSFRMVFLFHKVSCSHFISEVNTRQPKMLQFLEDLEQCAVQLDRMNKGAKISSVTGSSVGVVGGVLSIVGFALVPVTAGASLGLLIGGGVLGALSGTNSAVTTLTEVGVNKTQTNKASEAFQKFMEDMQCIQDYLGEVIRQPTPQIEEDFFLNLSKGIKKLDSVARGLSSRFSQVLDVGGIIYRNLVACSAEVVVNESQALSKASAVAAEIPEMSQAGFKGSLGLSKSARAGAIALNALFIGMDVFFICKDSMSLAKGSETEHSQLIRARAALWKSEMNSWQKICESLKEGLKTSENKKSVLERTFYLKSNSTLSYIYKSQQNVASRGAILYIDDYEEIKKHKRFLYIAVLGVLLCGFVVYSAIRSWSI